MEKQKPRFKVLCPIEGRDDKTHWARTGVGFTNKDGSTNLYLDTLPLKFDGKLQIRDWDEEDDRKRLGQSDIPF